VVEFVEDGHQTVTCAVPQGSVLEPILWNVMCDDLLRVDFGETTRVLSSKLVAIADNVAVVTTSHTIPILEEITNKILELVAEWMEETSFKLSIQKMEAIMLTIKRGYEKSNFMIRGNRVQLNEQL